jgi:hypothetical protein
MSRIALRSAVALWFVTWTATLPAATPRDELLRFVPGDVGFCLVVQDLRGHAARLASSPFMEQWSRSPLAKSLRETPEVVRLVKQQDEVRKQLGLDWSQLRDDILGDALAFAYRPGPPGKPDQEQGLLLLRAREQKPLADLMARLFPDGKGVEEREHNGVKYFRRAEKKETMFYHLRGPVLLVTSQELMLQQAIDVDRKLGVDAEPPVLAQLRRLGLDKALLVVWINPRAFDPDLQQKIDGAKGDDLGALKNFAVYWKALESAAVSAALEKELTLSLAIRAKMDLLPRAARVFLTEASRPCELWRSFPDNAMLAVAFRFDSASFVEMVSDFLPKDGLAKLRETSRFLAQPFGKDDFVKEVLPSIGPDLGLCLIAPPSSEKNWYPISVLALRVAGEGQVDQALLSAVNLGALGMLAAHNSRFKDQPIKLKTITQGKREVKYLTSDRFAPGQQPAFGLGNGFLLLASSPDALARFATPGTQPLPDANAPVPLLRASLKEMRLFLKDRRDVLAASLSEQNRITREEAGQSLDSIIAVLQFLDRIEIRQRTAAGQVTLSLVVQTAQPLKKN